MNFSNYRVTLDLHNNASQALLRLNKHETARKITFVLTEDGKPYKIAEDLRCMIVGIKPDDTDLVNNCEVDAEHGIITYTLTPQTTSCPGVFDCQLVCIDESDATLFSPIFSLEVRDVIIDDIDLESTSEFDALITAYNALVSRINELNSLVSPQ